jgi:alkanesulfonate monooxygenase SsuD/methylene tetrahydromethanopterin reductase-like flavin-dependent oxidoreductase (luciferase family)
VASLDSLSHGRVLFGIGAGWNAEEMEDHGTEQIAQISGLFRVRAT